VIVLVGMSAGELQRRAELAALAREVDGSIAFLQLGDPSVSAELSRLADAGCERVSLVAVRLGPLAPAHSWVRRIAAHWLRHHPTGLEISTCVVESLDPLVVHDAVAAARPLTGNEAGLTSAAWADVPGHRHQVLVCRGPRCTAKGAEEGLRGLILALMEHNLGDDDVLVTHTGCQFPCNHAPVVSVQPDDVWYGAVTPEIADRIVTDHLIKGTPVAPHRLERDR
jgi:(2Fe-2S) ferredoxin